MDFDVRDGETTVTTTMNFVENPKRVDDRTTEEDMVLDGDETSVWLVSLEMNGRSLVEGVDYELAVFERVALTADANAYPVLLSNGNLVSESVDDETKRHTAVWSDPHPKPSYLFCVVAGDLGRVSDEHVTTPSGRRVTLNVYLDQ